jgi:cytoskeletal protein RodZ
MHNFNDIHALLEKYWEGETTLEEERALKAYFAEGAPDERLRPYAPLFQALREEQAVQLAKSKVVPLRPQAYNWQRWAAAASVALLLGAGWWMFSKEPAAALATDEKQEVKTTQPIEKQLVESEKLASAAEVSPKAAQPPSKKKSARPRPKLNPEEEAAMAEIKAALALVSSKIGKGRREAAKGATHLESMDKIFKKKKDAAG